MKGRYKIVRARRKIVAIARRARRYVQTKGLRKIFAISGVAVVAGVAILVLLANYLPGYWYKDIITVGDATITHSDVAAYRDEILKYKAENGVESFSSDDTEISSDDEVAFDDLFKNAALREQAKSCGIDLDSYASDMNPTLDYSRYDFTLVREQNDVWQRVLENCVIQKENILAVAINFDIPLLIGSSPENAHRLQEDALLRISALTPLFERGAAAEELLAMADGGAIGGVTKNSGTLNRDDLPIVAELHVCDIGVECLNSDARLYNDPNSPSGLVNANAVYKENIHTPGDWIGPIAGDNGVFAFYRLESVTGQYGSWDEFYAAMRQDYAYDQTITPVLALITNVAETITGVLFDWAYACNSLGAVLTVKDEYGVVIPFSPGTCELWLDTTWASGVSYFSKLCAGSSDGHGDGPNTGGSNNVCDKGPLNCVGINAIGLWYGGQGISRNPLLDGTGNYYINDINNFIWVDDCGHLATMGGVARPGTSCSQPAPNGILYNQSSLDWGFAGQWLGAGWDSPAANQYAASGVKITITVKRKAFQPTATSQAGTDADSSTRTVVYANPGETLTDTLTTATTGDTWISGTRVKYCSTMYGPYQSAQAANVALSISQSGGAISGVPSQANVGSSTKCTGEAGQPAHATGVGQSLKLNFGAVGVPGYYYFVTNVDKGGSSPANNVKEYLVSKFNPTPPASAAGDNEVTAVRFQPFVTSNVSNQYVVPGSTIADTVTSHAASSVDNANNGVGNDGYWLNSAPVTVCVRVWGPYKSPQPNGTSPLSGSAPALGVLVAAVCTDGHTEGAGGTVSGGNYTAANQSRSFVFDTTGWAGGYYYFTEHIDKAAQDASTQNLVIDSFDSKFNPSDQMEWGVLQFQPYATSSLSSQYVDDGTSSITDTLTAHAATSLDDANKKVSTDEAWLQDSSSPVAYVPAKFCVVPFGPYQYQPSLPDPSDPSRPDATTDLPAPTPPYPSGVVAKEAKCNDHHGPNRQKGYTWDTSNWTPGYYYFVSYFVKTTATSGSPSGLVAQPTSPTNHQILFIDNWTSKLNPSNEREAAVDRFQIKATSKVGKTQSLSTYPTGIKGDTSQNGVIDDSDTNVAVPILRPETNYISDSIDLRAYDTSNIADSTSNANDTYWLKDKNNKYITFKVCVNLYGPYQQPIGGQDGDSTTIKRNPRTAIGNTSDTATDQASKRLASREYCFWTDGSTATSGSQYLAAKPTDDGGPGTYEVRWNNTGNDYFTPGYYYAVWSVKKSDNTAANTVALDSTISMTNGDFLESDWYSPFGEQTEAFVVPFQPIARSLMLGNRSGRNDNSPNAGRPNNSDAVGKGAVFDCKENKEKVTFGDGDGVWSNLPPEKLTCQNVRDVIYIGATDYGDINTSTNVVTDSRADNEKWLKKVDGAFEAINYQVKLYGPFADPEGRQPTTGVGKTVQTVPYSGAQWKAPYNMQPIAASCETSAANGPKYNINSNDYYVTDGTTLRQNISGTNKETGVGIAGSGTACTTSTTTDLKLAPGFYVSVVEILLNRNTSNNNILIKDFYSAWGDPYESLSIPLPVYVRTLRGNSSKIEYSIGETINDKIWIAGFAPYLTTERWPGDPNPTTELAKDALGNDMHWHSTVNQTGFGGKPGYFAPDLKANIRVTLYGPYSSQPTTDDRVNYCKAYTPGNTASESAAKVAGRWEIESKDQLNGWSIPNYSLNAPGWYVYYVEYAGDDRVYPFSSKCNDADERLYVSGDDKDLPVLKTAIQPVKDKAPAVINDIVDIVGGIPDSGSIVKLTLYRQLGASASATTDQKLCAVQFTVSNVGRYSTALYLDADGTVKTANSPANPPTPNRCFATTGGTYYWIEDFLKPDGTTHYEGYETPFTTPNDGESITIDEEKPTVVTTAQTPVYVGDPFSDTARVTIPEGSTRQYDLWFEAFGPQAADGSAPVCNAANKLFTTETAPITVTKTGDYQSGVTTATSPGNVYWIEHLTDKDTGQEAATGQCGKEGEITRVEQPSPNITTHAQPNAKPGDPIYDVAVVSGIAKDDPHSYRIVVEAYGVEPFEAAPQCSNKLHSWEKTISWRTETNVNAEYQTDSFTTPNQIGKVYWIERLIRDDGVEVSRGSCGQPSETTRLGEPPQPPIAGLIIRSVLTIAAIGGLLGLGFWQMLRRNPQLLARRRQQ